MALLVSLDLDPLALQSTSEASAREASVNLLRAGGYPSLLEGLLSGVGAEDLCDVCDTNTGIRLCRLSYEPVREAMGDYSGLPPEILEMLGSDAGDLSVDISGYLVDLAPGSSMMDDSFMDSLTDLSSTMSEPPSPFVQDAYPAPHTPAFTPATPNTPSQPMGSFQSTTELINQVLRQAEVQSAAPHSMKQQQARFFSSLPHDEAVRAQLVDSQKALMTAIQQELQQLRELQAQVLLSSSELHRIEYLFNELSLQSQQLELYYHELDQLRTGQAIPKPIATLAIVRQPFPMVPSKGSSLEEDALVVQLLTGATVAVQQLSVVKACIVSDTPLTKGDVKVVENDSQIMERQFLVAKFPLLFKEGTRKLAAKIRFEVKVEVLQSGKKIVADIESCLSKPFVVMTNQKQWEACERQLLMGDAFMGQSEITWNQFANCLQKEFIRATRQDPTCPTRCLSVFDFSYLHHKFLNKRRIMHQREYDPFWNWYGRCLQVIKYQRHMAQLWQGGLVYGFMTREEVDMALRSQPPGTFILRFSERHAGQLGIAYVGAEPGQVKHYLVQPNDTAAAKVTLADFLRDKRQFRSILQYTMLPCGNPRFTTMEKDNTLEKFYSKRFGGDTSGSGYDPL